MLKVEPEELDDMETKYPAIRRQINRFEDATLPDCSHCGSCDTADVQCGIIGRTIQIATATTKIKLVGNGPRPGKYFCNACQQFFD